MLRLADSDPPFVSVTNAKGGRELERGSGLLASGVSPGETLNVGWYGGQCVVDIPAKLDPAQPPVAPPRRTDGNQRG
ncbi:hypothetical protein ACLBOM_37795 [Escherichia coli]